MERRPVRPRPVRPRIVACAAVTLASAVLSCAEPPEPLLGEWVRVGGVNPQMTYIFEPGGQARWVLELGQGPDTFAVAYRVDYRTSPVHLDVGPWSTGPLVGRTLLGIVEIQSPDRFRVDFEPGDPGGDGSERPAGFSDQTVTFVRTLH